MRYVRFFAQPTQRLAVYKLLGILILAGFSSAASANLSSVAGVAWRVTGKNCQSKTIQAHSRAFATFLLPRLI